MHRHSAEVLSVVLVATALSAISCDDESPDRRTGSQTNLLLVTVDTLRADRLGVYGYRFAETPNLDALAQLGTRFLGATTPVPLTLPAHASILSGLASPAHGLRVNGGAALEPHVPTIAEHLRTNGFRTGAFVGAFVLDHRFGLARGFDRYDDAITRPLEGELRLESERRGEEVVDRALSWLDDVAHKGKPFFAWVHLFDPHAPYSPPEPWASRLAGRQYDGEIAYADEQVGRLLTWLDGRGLRDTTLVAVVGDHGEGLGEHGEVTHGLLLFQSTLRVPQIVAGPGVEAGRVVRAPTSLIDLAPTLAGLVGTPFTPVAERVEFAGRDLSPWLHEGQTGRFRTSVLYAESRYPEAFGWPALTTLREGDLKLILGAKDGALYDLANDPHERRDVTSLRRREYAALRKRLRQFPQGSALGSTVLDPETRDRLTALGYVSSARPTTIRPVTMHEMTALFSRFENAGAALVEGETAEAMQLLRTLVAGDPGNPIFRLTLARALRDSGEVVAALDCYREALVLAPTDPDAWYELGVALQEAGAGKEALTALTESVRLAPERAQTLNALGVVHAAAGRHREASQVLRRATELDELDPRAWTNLGHSLRLQEQWSDAQVAYRRALSIAPHAADAWNGLGTLDVARGRPRAALPSFERALAIAPTRHEVVLNRAIALETAGSRTEAIAVYREFLVRTEGAAAFAALRDTARRLLARLERSHPS